MLSTRVRTLPGRTAAHAWWTALFSSATVEGGSSISGIQTDIWSQACSIGFMSGLRAGQSMTLTSCWSEKGCRVTCCMGRGSLGRKQSYVQTPQSPMATFDFSGSECTDAGSWLHPPRPAHSYPHGGLHPTPWLTDQDFHHWRYSVSIVWGPTLCASSPTHGSVACAPKWA